MSVLLNDDQKAFREIATRFAKDKLADSYLARARTHVLDRALLKEMGSLGLIGVDIPEAFGGMGQSSVTAGVIVETIAEADFNVSYVQLLGSLIGGMIAKHASPDIAREWLPKVVSGEALLALGLTEPRGGSDAANLQMRATRSGNGWRLNGEKTSISLSDQADAAVVFARTGDPNGGSRGVSAFFVDLKEKGISRTHFDDIGTRPVGRGSLFFDDVYVPAEAMILDRAGINTFTSISRTKEVFGFERFTIVSQAYHNVRALFIAEELGAEAIGFNAKDMPPMQAKRSWLRERGSRVKMWLDLLG